MLIGRVLDIFEIKERGIVVATDTPYKQLPRDLKLMIGDPIELRKGDNVVLQTNVVGLEFCDPPSPDRTFGFLIPNSVRKAEVPIGSEVWTLE